MRRSVTLSRPPLADPPASSLQRPSLRPSFPRPNPMPQQQLNSASDRPRAPMSHGTKPKPRVMPAQTQTKQSASLKKGPFTCHYLQHIELPGLGAPQYRLFWVQHEEGFYNLAVMVCAAMTAATLNPRKLFVSRQACMSHLSFGM